MTVSAVALAAAVSAMEALPGRARELPAKAPAVAVEQGGLALEAIENLIPSPGAEPSQITFAVVSDGDTPAPDGRSPLEDMTAWQVQILDSSGRKVSFIQGRGEQPPPMLAWSGSTPGGEHLPGGFYSARLVWMDKANKPHAARPVPFNLFSPLKTPKFSELKLDIRFPGGFPSL